jgi:serine/threonine-protein kinase RIO1
VEVLAGAGVVHADLSAFNILVHEGEPWFIDFSEALRVDRTGEAPWMRLEEARMALDSGLSALQKYFNRYALEIDVRSHSMRIVRSLDRFGVLD